MSRVSYQKSSIKIVNGLAHFKFLGDILEEGLRDYPTFVEKRILIHGK
jgi:hypothetical protein